MVDARGHGRSEAPERGYGPVEQAADVAGAVTALGLAMPAILSHYIGAVTALVLAGSFPDVPGALLLVDPPASRTGWTASPGAKDRHQVMRERSGK